MIDTNNIPSVESEEWLARFILQSSHIRRSDQTVKPDAFIPHPHQDLSVTRHLQATVDELWAVGDAIAAERGRTHYGRGDVRAEQCHQHKLAVDTAPVGNNPNHANISGWPTDKPAQKIIALEIAATVKFVPRND